MLRIVQGKGLIIQENLEQPDRVNQYRLSDGGYLTLCYVPEIKSRRCSERGVSLVELAIVVPLLLVFFVIGTLEVGSLINTYQKVNQIVNEAARLGSKTSDLSTGKEVSADTDFATISALSHVGMHIRVAELIKHHDLLISAHTTTSELRKRGDCATSVPPCAPADEDTVEVTARVVHNSLFPYPFDSWPISVSRTVPWLYGDSLDPEF